MTRTLVDGKWINDPLRDYSDGKARPVHSDLIARQKASMASTLASVAQCANITQVRKCLEHGRQSYPTK